MSKKLNEMPYFQLAKKGTTATVNVYGRIGASYGGRDGDETNVSKLAKQLDDLENVTQIDVFINSNGGDVSEGLAVYNALKRHSAKVTTFCDGFACSAASVIFMAGDERIMSTASLLMIHNAWSYGRGNASEMRKLADDLDKITSASINAYMTVTDKSREHIMQLMDNETWLDAEDCIELGFATSIEEYDDDAVNQSVIGMKSKLNSKFGLNNEYEFTLADVSEAFDRFYEKMEGLFSEKEPEPEPEPEPEAEAEAEPEPESVVNSYYKNLNKILGGN